MTRAELLQLVVAQARSQGFAFRRWWMGPMGLPWESAEAAVAQLALGRQCYMLLFAHEFAQSFWRGGTEMVLQVEAQQYERVRPDGSVMEVKRKGYVRRRTRDDAWRYHLREMAASEEPLRYVRRFLRVEELLEDSGAAARVQPTKTEDAVVVDEEDLLPEE